MTRLTATKARIQFAGMLNRVSGKGQCIVIRRRGKDLAALIPMEEYEFLERKIREAEDKADRKAIREAKKDIAKHGTISFESLKRKYGL